MSTQQTPPANRAERRAAARGRAVPGPTHAPAVVATRVHTKPARGGASGPRRTG